jgi:hypothetical protein
MKTRSLLFLLVVTSKSVEDYKLHCFHQQMNYTPPNAISYHFYGEGCLGWLIKNLYKDLINKITYAKNFHYDKINLLTFHSDLKIKKFPVL